MAKKQENQRGNGPLSGRLVVVVGMILILSLVIGSTVVAQDDSSSVSGGQDRRMGPRMRGAYSEVIPALPEAIEASMFVATLVQTIDTSAFIPPSPDPAGIVYLDSSDTLLIADSEVDEMPIYFTGDNLFESTLSGSLVDTLTTIAWSSEPTGVTYNPGNGHLFFSDDVADKIYETNVGAGTVYRSFSTRGFDSYDPEGIAFAPGLGALFIADGVGERIYKLTPGGNGVFDGVSPEGDDQVVSFSLAGLGVTDPEGVAFNPENDLLYIGGTPRTRIAETTTEGTLVRMIDISEAPVWNVGDLGCGPSSEGTGEMHIYIADRGVDNDTDPTENDGKVYEMTLPPNTPDPTIVKAVEPDSAPLGGEIVYTLSFWNAGEGTAMDVVITDIIPESVTVQSVESSGASITDTGADPPYVWDVQDLGPLEGGVITITAEVSETLSCGELVDNEASIGNTGGDSEPGNNSSSVSVVAGVGVTVEPSSDAGSGDPGSQVVYSLEVTNSGSCWDTYDFSVSGNAWSTVGPATVGPLAPGTSEVVEVTVTVPGNAQCGDDVATVTYTSQNSGAVSASSILTTTANAIYGVTVQPPSDSASGDPGAGVIYTLRVTNAGNCSDTYGVGVSGNEWSTVAPGTVGPLAPGASADVAVTVTVAGDAGCGDVDSATVTVTSQGDGAVFGSSGLTTTANAVYGVSVEPASDAGSGDPGAGVVYTLRVTNVGNCRDTYDRSVIGNTWLVSAPAKVGPLDPGVGKDVAVTVGVPGDAQCGDSDSAAVGFTSRGDGGVSDSSVVTTSANTVYGVTVEPSSDGASANPGAEVGYTLRVTNGGNCEDTFDYSVSGNAWSTAGPAEVGPLAPGGWDDVTVTVSVPGDAECGSDVATVRYTSQHNGAVSDSSILTTTAKAVYGMTVEPSSDADSGDPGAGVVYSLLVRNEGNCEDTFELGVSGEVWGTVVPGTVGPLAPGAGSAVEVTVTVPGDAGCGDVDSATVTVTSQGNGAVTGSSELTTSANTVYGVSVEPSSDAGSGDPGAEVVYTLGVTNTGNCEDSYDRSVSGNLWSTNAPIEVGPLAAGVGTEVEVRVSVPACTVGGASDAVEVMFTSQNEGAAWDSSTLTTAANQVAPVAEDEEYSTAEETPLEVAAPGVLGNDSDANCDELSASLETGPAHGTVVVGADGSITYTPTVNYVGMDSFTYYASDEELGDTAVVTVTVASGGDDPIVEAGEDQTADEGEMVYFAGSFIDPAVGALYEGEDLHWDFGDGGSATGSLTPEHAYRDNGEYTVRLTVTDAEGDVGQDSLLVTVLNVAPMVNAGPDRRAVPGEVVVISGSFIDPGLDDTHSIEWDPGDGTATIGTLAFSHAYGETGEYTVTLTVTDDDGGVGSDSVVIDVKYPMYLPLVVRGIQP